MSLLLVETLEQRLFRVIAGWQELLQQWSSDGRLAAASESVLKPSTTDASSTLTSLLGQWAIGEMGTLPKIEILTAEQLPGAAGAYAASTQTIYFNISWLEAASDEAIQFVLTEEFGHWLDGELNAEDTPGDEGAELANQLLGEPESEWKLAPDSIGVNDTAWININSQSIEAELSAIMPKSQLIRIFPSSDFGGSFYSNISFGDNLYFNAPGDGIGNELWKTDGTASGTVLVEDIYAGDIGSNPFAFIFHKDILYFSATPTGSTNYSAQLWKYDEAAEALTQLTDIQGFGVGYSIFLGDKLFFEVYDATLGMDLWALDTDTELPTLVKDFGVYDERAGIFLYNSAVFKDNIYFLGYTEAHGEELWTSNGTKEGTYLLKDIRAGTLRSSPNSFALLGESLYFGADDGVNGSELWKTDGTFDGTLLVADINPGPVGSSLYGMVALNDLLLFYARTSSGFELWKSDGTAEGTSMVKDINPLGSSYPNIPFTVVGSSVYFTADDGTGGREIWKTDGTAEGTFSVTDINTDNSGLYVGLRSLVGTTLYFVVTDRVTGDELWSLDVSSEFISCFTISADTPEKLEGNTGLSPFTYIVTRTGDLSEACTISWTTKGIGLNPANAEDFENGFLPSGTLNFAVGQSIAQIIVNVIGDATQEANEEFKIVLSGAPTGSALSKSTANGIIRNDDGTYLTIAPQLASNIEGDAGTTVFTFTVTRSGDITDTSEVDWFVAGSGLNPASASDFSGIGNKYPAGNLLFEPGETEKTIGIEVSGDTSFEADEKFVVTLVNPIDAAILVGSAEGVIRNDDTPPLVSISGSSSRLEGNAGEVTEFIFTVSRVGDSSNGCSVDWAVTGLGSAPATEDDFVGGEFPSGTVIFAANETSKAIKIQVQGDINLEQDESFVVTLSNPVGVSISTANASGTINNDDALPELSIASLSADQVEGSSIGSFTPFTFTVIRTGDLSQASSASWSVSGISVSGSDFEGGVLPSGTVSFLVGAARATITVNVAADIALEADEPFNITLTDPVGATIKNATATGIIRNDDTVPKLSIVTTSASDQGEGYSGLTAFTFTVLRSGDLTNASSASWAVLGTGLNPASASDFQGGSFPRGTVQFAAGEATATITINVLADQAFEASETFVVTLSNPVGSTITTATATGIIRNDDLIGTSKGDALSGSSLSEFIDGRKGQDVLTGGFGADIFGFRFGQSLVKSPDRITDFEFGQDKIDLFTSTGRALAAPTTFFRAADNSNAISLTQLASAVFADADGSTDGNQSLAANGAVLVTATNTAIAGTYLFINNGTASFGSSADLVVNLTGYTGSLPSLGAINPTQVFI